ncbi:hypothetical protein Q4577_23540 [Marinovum sp. 2_MG-2023]|uniref:hypothetical protein n=1 Tax=unclassified Marinovum TaxID=2647166 RepID=UPI0026E44229|nr:MULTISPECIES: hypothetical protein [unclassified Marinovum]MDO6732982.1 hypothetical protein [Marinovum sp. 2_MG-2023]MDO6782244.1 hypothetical protein [Marinovum sp. 1_MG-2023]
MKKHDWLADVILDMQAYITINGVEGELPNAIAEAARVAKGQHPFAQTKLISKADKVLQYRRQG